MPRDLEKQREWRRNRKQSDPEYAAKLQEQQRQWRAEHPDYHKAWYVANADRMREKARRYAEANAERRRDYARERMRELRRLNPAAVKAAKRRHQLKARETQRAWAKANQDRIRDYARRRRALRLQVTAERYREADIFDRDQWRCQLCRSKIDWRLRHPHPRSRSIDHVVPLSLGGTDEPRNVQAAHLRCNLEKYNNATRRGEQLRLIG